MSTETVAIRMGFPEGAALALEQACIRFGIDTTLRKVHFLGQVAHESATGRYMEEIASGRAYEGRADLGNTEPGDGVRFKGRGLIQLTGRSNYGAYSLAIHGDDRAVQDPAMVARLPDAALAAGWFWQAKGLNALADRDSLELVTRRINGGLNGLADRARRLQQAKRLFAEMAR
jgi:putative chitinase